MLTVMQHWSCTCLKNTFLPCYQSRTPDIAAFCSIYILAMQLLLLNKYKIAWLHLWGTVSLPLFKQRTPEFQLTQVRAVPRVPKYVRKLPFTWRKKSPQPVLLRFHHHHYTDRRCNHPWPLCTRHLWNFPGISGKSWHTPPYLLACMTSRPVMVLEGGDNFETKMYQRPTPTEKVKFARIVCLISLQEALAFDR